MKTKTTKDLLAAAIYAACPKCQHNRCQGLRDAIAQAKRDEFDGWRMMCPYCLASIEDGHSRASCYRPCEHSGDNDACDACMKSRRED